MAKRYFQKFNARIYLLDKDSKPVPFERLADNHGAIALDTENAAHKALLESLDAAILKGIGGVVELADEAAYQELKKKLDPSKAAPRRPSGIRIADQNPMPELREPSLPPAGDAGAPGSVGRAEDSTPARPATALGASSGGPLEAAGLVPRGRKVRTAKVAIAEDGTPSVVSPPADTGGGKKSAES